MRRNFFAVLGVVLGSLALSAPAGWAAAPKEKQSTEGAGVYKVAIDPGVSLADAAESMRLRANALNLKLVAELPLSKQRTITIFQFCDAVTAKELIDMSMDFAIYMPCRITMIEDANGKGWLIMPDINVDLVAKEKNLQQELTARIKKVREGLIEIIQAGAHGEL